MGKRDLCGARLVAGFAALPPAMFLVTFLGYLAIGPSGRSVLADGVTIAHPVAPALELAFLVGIIGGVLTVGGAVPSVLWLIRHGQLRLSHLLVLGTLIGNVPFVVIVLAKVLAGAPSPSSSASVARLWYGWEGAIRFVAIGTVHGAVAALVFWLIAAPERHHGCSGQRGSAIVARRRRFNLGPCSPRQGTRPPTSRP